VMIEALAAELPGARLRGIAAGLHVTVDLPAGHDEAAVRRVAAARGIGLATMADYRSADGDHPATLILGYAQMSESRIRSGVRELADAVRAARGSVLRLPDARDR
jgi:GntR family transcriptional regulator / MocR family aminotransferase